MSVHEAWELATSTELGVERTEGLGSDIFL
jgi:hypothetical protein